MTPLERLTDAVDELVRPRTHREPYTYKDDHGTVVNSRHITHVASLLEQIGACVYPSGETRLDQGHPVPSSRPNASIEAIDALASIDDESSRLFTYLGGTDRGDVAGNLRGLIGRATPLDDDTQTYLASCASRWASRAKSVTGWEVEPFKPENTCPLCAQKRTLRIRAFSASDVHASCVSCGEVWTPDTVGLLAEHIRWENGDLEEVAS